MRVWTALAGCALAVACGPGKTDEGDVGSPLIDPTLETLLWPMVDPPDLPADTTNAWADDPTAAWFGRFLYFDTRLSSTGEFSCATCHAPSHGFSDGLPVSEAAGVTDRHAPGLWNVPFQRWLFWDGRCDSLWCQAAGPLEAEHEMDITRMELARVISEHADLADAYAELFGPPPDTSDTTRFPASARPVPADPDHPDAQAWDTMSTADQAAVTEVLVHVAKAIAAYERTLVSTDTPVDRFVSALQADDRAAALAALTDEERHGLELFAGDGQCVFCHSGWEFSNKEFHNLGLPEVDQVDYLDIARYDGIDRLRDHEFNATSPWSDDPTGPGADRLALVAQTTEQLGQFKTPGLRGVADHPPYMHGGHFESLEAVVAFYADPTEYDGPGHREELIVARGWDDTEQAALVAFLRALSPIDSPDPSLLEPPATPLP